MMKSTAKKGSIGIVELLILTVLWIIVFASPVLVQLLNDEVSWDKVFVNWSRLLPFFVLFFFNHFVLFPLIFVRFKKVWYLIGVALTLALFSIIMVQLKPHNRVETPPFEQRRREGHRPPPPQHNNVERPQRPRPDNQPGPRGQGPAPLPPFINTALIALLIIGFDTGLRGVFRWTRSEQERDKLEKEKVKTELAFLRNQVNPHFLMNTLNNIHALIDFDTDEAKDTVIRLSKLMRYLLYDTERNLIPIREEISFIRSYVELMEMRISKRVKVNVRMEVLDEQKTIPPLLFTSLIENAFKYGVSNQKDTVIDISVSTTESELEFLVSNTIAQKKNESTEHSGIGLGNTQKRLDILFDKSYTLEITNKEDTFTVRLKIPL